MIRVLESVEACLLQLFACGDGETRKAGQQAHASVGRLFHFCTKIVAWKGGALSILEFGSEPRADRVRCH